MTTAETDGWSRVAVEYALHFGDYGGEAMVDCRVRRFGENTVVAVFMCSPKVIRRVPAETETDGVLKSFAAVE